MEAAVGCMPLKSRGNNAACLLAVSSRLFSLLTSETVSHVQRRLISSVSNRRPGTEITTTRRPRALEGRRARPAADTRHTAVTTAANRVRYPPPPRRNTPGDIGLFWLRERSEVVTRETLSLYGSWVLWQSRLGVLES